MYLSKRFYVLPQKRARGSMKLVGSAQKCTCISQQNCFVKRFRCRAYATDEAALRSHVHPLNMVHRYPSYFDVIELANALAPTSLHWTLVCNRLPHSQKSQHVVVYKTRLQLRGSDGKKHFLPNVLRHFHALFQYQPRLSYIALKSCICCNVASHHQSKITLWRGCPAIRRSDDKSPVHEVNVLLVTTKCRTCTRVHSCADFEQKMLAFDATAVTVI